ncbi:heat shock 70 kDa protein 12A-like [Mya arenaria]|uniref:heat shock 70 kDa protein 12A-like n=1 Tax=Mya arenaria TaxID=6604 RepID=UPI0022DF93A5|nr:heat shock 70 kDa protein 12A-like [Mya arenaria]
MASGNKCKTIPNIIVSLDFGTTYSGYGLAFPVENIDSRNELTIYTNPSEEKVPTCVLLNEDKSFHSFGSQALDEYIDMDNDERENVYFFQNFKMALYENRNLSRDIEIEDEKGKKLPAKLVFQLAISGLKCIVMQRIDEHHQIHKDEDISKLIQWMITIPAIWTDSARQFMREATEGAGIPNNRVRLVLEPEAASLFCRKQKIVLTKSGRRTFAEGQKYIIADLGGGTIDICVHEILEDGHLKELYRATGEDAGGTKVNAQFECFLASLFGRDVVDDLRKTCYERFITQMRDFEERKKTFKGTERNIKIRLDTILMKRFETKSGKSLQNAVQESDFSTKVKYDNNSGRMTFDTSVIKAFYNGSVQSIITKVKTIIKECAGDELTTILLVGGYAESHYLRNKVRQEFPTIDLVLVEDAKLAVIKGSVMMGLEERNIVQRRSRFTYGFSIARTFIEGVDPERLKFYRDGEVKCSKVFDKWITKGQMLTYNQTFKCLTSNKLEQAESKKMKFSTALYRSTKEDPEYCTDEERCELVGRVNMEPPTDGWPDLLEAESHLIVGETEFTVKTYNKYSGEELQATLDFL